MKKFNILILDNYDSFTYNLVHAIQDILKYDITVKRNDEIAIEAINDFDAIILSPGPGLPDEAGILKEVIKQYAPTKSIFGVCLGLQAIGECFGASLKNLDQVYHGIKTNMIIETPDEKLFEDIDTTFEAGRYHSWTIDESTLNDQELEVTCRDEQGEIMAIRHKKYNIRAVQFHPESVLTPCGNQLLSNYLKNYIS